MNGSALSEAWLKRIQFLLLLFFLLVPAAQAAQVLEARLEADKTHLKPGDKPVVRFVLTNRSKQQVRVLKWLTPLDGFRGDIFEIKRDHQPVHYQGRLVKRGEPKGQDFVVLAPGQSEPVLLDLSKAYDFSQSGKYAVRFDGLVLEMYLGKTVLHDQPLVSNTLLLKRSQLDPTSSVQPDEVAADPAGKDPKFKGCSPDRIAELKGALTHAKAVTVKAHDYLNKHASSTKRYVWMFGKYSKGNHDNLLKAFGNIATSLQSKPIVLSCQCSKENQKDTYGYVYADRPYEIWVCDSFWKAGEQGYDSKAGTIIHEMSHFKIVAGTRDHRYNMAACLKLAKEKPALAINNANSLEYFAERFDQK